MSTINANQPRAITVKSIFTNPSRVLTASSIDILIDNKRPRVHRVEIAGNVSENEGKILSKLDVYFLETESIIEQPDDTTTIEYCNKLKLDNDGQPIMTKLSLEDFDSYDVMLEGRAFKLCASANYLIDKWVPKPIDNFHGISMKINCVNPPKLLTQQFNIDIDTDKQLVSLNLEVLM